MDVSERPERRARPTRSARLYLAEPHHHVLSPEQRLCLAILEDAINRIGGKAVQSVEAVREAQAWLDGAPGLLTFAYVCEALGWHPEWIRRGIQRQARIDVGHRITGRRGTGV